MNILERYRTQGLNESLELKQWWYFYLVLAGSATMMLVAILFMVAFDQAVLGLLGALFCGIVCCYHASTYIKSRNQELVIFSAAGIYLPQYQTEFLWQDLGPATTILNGEDLVLPLKNKSLYFMKFSAFERAVFTLSSLSCPDNPKVDSWGDTGFIAEETGYAQQVVEKRLEALRLGMLNEKDCTFLSVPRVVRLGRSQDFLTIINCELFKRHLDSTFVEKQRRKSPLSDRAIKEVIDL